MKKSTGAFIFSLLFIVFTIQNSIAQDDYHSSRTETFSAGIHGLYLPSQGYRQTFFLGSSFYRNTKRNWLTWYTSLNYYERRFGITRSGLTLELGPGFNFSFRERLILSLFTGVGYQRVHLYYSNQFINHRPFSGFGTLDFRFAFKQFDVGIITGACMGRGRAVTTFNNGNVSDEVVWSLTPKLGIQFRYYF